MRKSTILLVIGLVLLAVGAFIVANSSLHATRSFDASLPSGTNYVVQISGIMDGKFTATVDGDPATVYYLDEAQYHQFESTGSSQYIDTASGVGSVTISDSIPSSATYYIVIHPNVIIFPGSAATEHITVDVSGTVLWILLVGIVVMAIGAVAGFFSIMVRRDERAKPPIGTTIAEVPNPDRTSKQG